MPRRIDITGKQYNTLLVLKQCGKNNKGQLLWQCKCTECSNTNIKATSTDLNRGRRNYCSTCNQQKSKDSPIKSLYTNYQRNAGKAYRDFNIEFNNFKQLIHSDCHYCGTPPSQWFKKKESKEGVMYNGLDRQDNNKGYTLDNVVPCCKFCNFAKKTSELDEFESWLDRVAKHRTGEK